MNLDPVDVELGRRVKAARKAADMSQGALGKVLGISFQQVGKYETGANRISVRALLIICDAIKVSPAEILQSLAPGETPAERPAVDLRLAKAADRLSPASLEVVLATAKALGEHVQ